MCVHGPDGTDKSRLIDAINCYLVETQRNEKIRKLGPTAVSASLIGGDTIHSFLAYLRDTKRQKKTAIHTRYLFFACLSSQYEHKRNTFSSVLLE